MNWDGSTVYTLQGFRPDTRPAIKFERLADGNYAGNDRGSSEDVYKANISIFGDSADMSALEAELDANNTNFNLTLGSGEEIFGADIDYSGTLDVFVEAYGDIQHTEALQAYVMPIRLRLISPSFIGSASISDLRLNSYGYSPNSVFDREPKTTYDGTTTYTNGNTDPGLFKANYKQTFEQAKAIRRYLIVTARTTSVSFPSIGVDYPFGFREGTGPFNCRIIDWQDAGKQNQQDWVFNMTFARVI